ncbi:MAG: cytochrome b/b6 domain-containing protein [Pseudomonadota bacterium]
MRSRGLATANAPQGPYARSLRRLHLAIAILVSVLAVTGFMIYFRKPLGLQEFKLTLVFAHAIVAYVFLAILVARAYLGFRGAENVRFRHTLPRMNDLRQLFHLQGSARSRLKFAGRSPFSRAIAGILYATIAMNAATGLVRAGTDLYFPPFGPVIRGFVAADGVDPALVKPADKSRVDAARFGVVSKAKVPFGKIHIYGAFIIATIALFHATGVAATEWSAPNNPNARGRARLMLFGSRRP